MSGVDPATIGVTSAATAGLILLWQAVQYINHRRCASRCCGWRGVVRFDMDAPREEESAPSPGTAVAAMAAASFVRSLHSSAAVAPAPATLTAATLAAATTAPSSPRLMIRIPPTMAAQAVSAPVTRHELVLPAAPRRSLPLASEAS